MYEFLIQDEHGSILYVTEDKYHAKQIAAVMQMKLNKPIFVDCVPATLLDYMPIGLSDSIPEQRIDPY